MMPFTYNCLYMTHYGDVVRDVSHQTLRAAYEEVRRCICTRSARIISCVYPDGHVKCFYFEETRFMIKHEIDWVALRIEAKKLIEEENANPPKIYLKGFLYSDMGEDQLVNYLTVDRERSWKPSDDIDWAALDKELER